VYSREFDRKTTATEFETMRREYRLNLSDEEAHRQFDSHPGCAIRSGPIRRLETRLSFRVRLGKRERPAEPPRSWFVKSRDLLSGVVS
jgi:hypothetical protein